MPMGLRGAVAQVAAEPLQGGDRVLFYTDGITESESVDGEPFGSERLADHLVTATLDRVPVAETVGRLSAHLLRFVGNGLKDDATMFLIEYR
jgi:serine phosphatase RsbU (regulator of sigma subunit)